MLVALLALFIALGGPAQARRLIDGRDIRAGTVRSRQIKDHTIATRDLEPSLVRALQVTPVGSVATSALADSAVTSAKLASGAVTAVKLAPASVGPASLADGSVTGAKVVDGSLTTADIARFAGRFRVVPEDIGTILPQTCWTGEPHGLAPELAHADISQDAVLVTPLGRGIDDTVLSFTARTSGANMNDPLSMSRFVLSLCNVSPLPVASPPNGISFSYVVFDVL
jgi:hypothetical protein